MNNMLLSIVKSKWTYIVLSYIFVFAIGIMLNCECVAKYPNHTTDTIFKTNYDTIVVYDSVKVYLPAETDTTVTPNIAKSVWIYNKEFYMLAELEYIYPPKDIFTVTPKIVKLYTTESEKVVIPPMPKQSMWQKATPYMQGGCVGGLLGSLSTVIIGAYILTR